MQTQTAEEYLRRIIPMRSELARLIDRREMMRVQAEGVGAITYDKDKVQSSPVNSFEARMVGMIEEAAALDRRIAYLKSETHHRISQIKSLGGIMGAILYCRYVSGMSYAASARYLRMTQAEAYRLHQVALRKFLKRYNILP